LRLAEKTVIFDPIEKIRFRVRAKASPAVEHYLDMVGATGSNPVPPTILTKIISSWQAQPWSAPRTGFMIS